MWDDIAATIERMGVAKAKSLLIWEDLPMTAINQNIEQPPPPPPTPSTIFPWEGGFSHGEGEVRLGGGVVMIHTV